MTAPRDENAVEPVRGLPEALPPGERILWQGAPDPWRLAVEAFKLRWVAGYFALLAAWRVAASAAEAGLAQALSHAVPFLALGAAACAVIYAIAWVQARATVYTLTNRRVAMRIGAALTMTLNLPYRQIAAAGLDLRRGGTGTIALALPPDVRLSYLMTFPHVRPWRLASTEPALRCVPNAASVAQVFAEAAEARVHEPVVTRRPAAPVQAHPHAIAAE